MWARTSLVVPGHPDYEMLSKIRDSIVAKAGTLERLQQAFPILIREAVDFVLDPVRTARTKIAELDSVEKTFIGLKVEHFVRDFLDVPKGLRDVQIDGIDIDIKHTVKDAWTIPPESFRNNEPCLLIRTNEATHTSSLGIFLAHLTNLNPSDNRDAKKATSAASRSNILWIIERADYPKSRWTDIDMFRFREIRKIRGGKKRAVLFFSENLRRPIHRIVIHSLLLQHDYMKRLRKNGGARDVLRQKEIALLSGLYDSEILNRLNISGVDKEHMIAVSPGSSLERRMLKKANLID
jgi:hypothetical protein